MVVRLLQVGVQPGPLSPRGKNVTRSSLTRPPQVTAAHTVPMGRPEPPAPGPATPLSATPTWALLRRRTPSAMALTASRCTEPCAVYREGDIPKVSTLAALV